MENIAITLPQFKAANERLATKTSYTEIAKALKKPLKSFFASYPTLEQDFYGLIKEFDDADNQSLHKALTGEWLSRAIADKDYNGFIAELKAKHTEGTEDTALLPGHVDEIDFSKIEKHLVEFITLRHQHNVLSDPHEAFAACASLVHLIFGANAWSTTMAYRIIRDLDDLLPEVFSESKEYWVMPITIENGEGVKECHHIIKHEFTVKRDNTAPIESRVSVQEQDEYELECYSLNDMKDRFAWNNKRKRPATYYLGDQEVLVDNN